MKKILSVVLSIVLILGILPTMSFASSNKQDIVILYENDVHCEVSGYTKLAAMKKELQKSYSHVGVVSGGDFIQGTSLGVISTGEYAVELMNIVGYDAVVLGNHEFDFGLERLEDNFGKAAMTDPNNLRDFIQYCNKDGKLRHIIRKKG